MKRILARLLQLPLMSSVLAAGAFLIVPRHRIGAVVVVFDDRERALLLRHVFHPKMPWGLPGGWVARHESPADAALRELREETGLVGTLGPAVHMTREIRPRHLTVAFLASARGEITLSGEILEADWFDLDQLPAGADRYVGDTIAAARALHRRLAPPPPTVPVHPTDTGMPR